MKVTFCLAATCCLLVQLASCVPLASPATSSYDYFVSADTANLTDPATFDALILRRLRELSRKYENIDMLSASARYNGDGPVSEASSYNYIHIIAHDPDTNVEIHTHNFPDATDLWSGSWTQKARVNLMSPWAWQDLDLRLTEALAIVAQQGFPGPFIRVALYVPKDIPFLPVQQIYYSFRFEDTSKEYVFLGVKDRKIYRGFAAAVDAVFEADDAATYPTSNSTGAPTGIVVGSSGESASGHPTS